MSYHDKDYELERGRRNIELAEDWDKWIHKMPFIQFPANWQIRIIPPAGGAFVRFHVKLPSGLVKSVYFDALSRLGGMDEPYWEVYPYEGDCGRCFADEIPELLRMIADESPRSFDE